MHFIRLVALVAAPVLFGCPILSAQSAERVGDHETPPSQSGNFAVWQMQESGATAGLRGIDSVDGKVAWASGTGGTVLRTTDGGAHWLHCATPDADKDGATLDFRGVQAWDAQTAIIMASGPGDKSRLYKTTDGCKTWTLLFTNPDAPHGFFDSFWLNSIYGEGILLGDPTKGRFAIFRTLDGGKTWARDLHKGLLLHGRSLAAFAASNSCVARDNRWFVSGFATGGKGGAVFLGRLEDEGFEEMSTFFRWIRSKDKEWTATAIPITSGTESSGAFAVSFRYPVKDSICQDCWMWDNAAIIAVGGDYTKPNDSPGTAAFSTDGGEHWTTSTTPPHGYRSTVQWSESLHLWITAGTNGSDISRDDGKTWQPLDNGNWNALSLPFIVGPNGRIARLNPQAISKP